MEHRTKAKKKPINRSYIAKFALNILIVCAVFPLWIVMHKLGMSYNYELDNYVYNTVFYYTISNIVFRIGYTSNIDDESTESVEFQKNLESSLLLRLAMPILLPFLCVGVVAAVIVYGLIGLLAPKEDS